MKRKPISIFCAGVAAMSLYSIASAFQPCMAGIRTAMAASSEAPLLQGDNIPQEASAPAGTTDDQRDASRPQGSASLPQGSASLPQGSASLPQGSASLPQGSASLPQGSALLPQGGVQGFLQSGDASIALFPKTLAAIEAYLAQAETEEVAVPDEYANLAISNVPNYVNVRSLPGTDGEIVAKLYHGSVAQVLSTAGEAGEWFQIVSGEAEGYVKAEYFLYGAAAAAVIDDYVTRYAVVDVSRLNVRSQPDISSGRIGYIDSGEKAKLLEDQGEWMKVQYTDAKTGYVASQYVTVKEEFVYAKTLEEEARELAARKALEARAAASERTAAENTAVTVVPPSGNYSTNAELRASIVDYAMQFLGNAYIHGGRSLAGGTDCSGFTSLIYADFGYSLSRTPGGQLSGNGRSISYSEAQPGDIICYGKNGNCTHVALYIGNGQIIHSANPRKGVVISKADYDPILGVKNIID